MSKKQSSIEWLKQRVLYIVPSSQKDDLIKLFEQAEDMRKEEQADAWCTACESILDAIKNDTAKDFSSEALFEHYYKETFNT